MSEFRILYENQSAEFVKQKFEIGIPLPSSILNDVVAKVQKRIEGEPEEEIVEESKGLFGRKKKDSREIPDDEKCISMTSVACLLASVAIAAISKT